MTAIALYCAASVYIYQCKETQSSKNIGNLDFIIAAMDAIGREHVMTRAFLKQLLLDLERNNITQISHVPRVDNLSKVIALGHHNFPILSRSHISGHSSPESPLSGRLPPGNPRRNMNPSGTVDCSIGYSAIVRDNSMGISADPSKRKHGSPSSSGAARSGGSDPSHDHSPFCPVNHDQSPLWGMNETAPSSNTTPPEAQSQPQPRRSDPIISFQRTPWAGLTRGFTNKPIPVRTGSPAIVACEAPSTNLDATPTQSSSFNIPANPAIPSTSRIAPQQTGPHIISNSAPNFDRTNVCMYAQLSNGSAIATGDPGDSWDMSGQSGNVDWDALATSAGINIADFPNVMDASPGNQDGRIFPGQS